MHYFELYGSDFWVTQREVNYSNQYESRDESSESIVNETVTDRTDTMEFRPDSRPGMQHALLDKK